jgi:hypothetical protein
VAAVVEIQAATKWLIATLGAIAAVMVAGLSFAEFGSVDAGRQTAAVAGTLLAVGGVLWLLYQTLAVLVVEPVRLEDIGALPDGALDPTVIAPANTPNQLATEIPRLVAAAHTAYGQHLADIDNGRLRQAYKEAKNRADQWLHGGERAVARQRLAAVRGKFTSIRDLLFLKTLVILVGIGVAAWGLTGPTPKDVSIGVLTKTPTNVIVQFEKVDFDATTDPPAFASILGEPCVNSEVAHPAVALKVVGDTYTLAMVGSDSCPAQIVEVNSTQAKVALPPS